MGQTLTNGIYLPDEGERNSYSGLEANWRTLDALILTVNGKAAPNVANTWTAAQTFNAGIAGDLTGNVTGNVTGDLTGTAARAIADEDGTSIKSGYVNVAGNQTVTGDKSFTGSNTFNNILPNATNSYALGSSSYQWSSVYAQSYYYNGTAWGLDKTNVWTENNRFSKNSALSDITSYTDTSMSFTGNSNTIFFNTRGSSNYPSYGTFLFAGYMSGTEPDRYGQLKLLRSTDLKGGTNDGYVPDTSFNLWRVSPHYSLMDFMEAVRVQNNGTVNFLAPITTNATDLGTSTNQWKSVYAQSYYYNGTQWGLDKENTWTQNQIIASGTNDKCYLIKDTVYELGQDYPNGEHLGGLTIHDKNGTVVGLLDIVDRSYGNMEMRIRVQQKFDPNSNNRSTSGTTLFNELILGITPTKTNYIGFKADLWGDNTHNLGTSTNKWKTLNGINPGALGIPGSSYVEIDTTNWDLTGASSQSYTPAVHGWLYISIQNIAGNYLSIVGGRGAVSMDGTGAQAGLRAVFPVIANESISITIKTGSIFAARFYPMLGNV